MSISRGTRLAGLGLLALGSLLGLASPAHADYPVAPDVVVFCEPTLQHVVADIGALWRARTGIKVRVFTSPTPALLQQIAHHARDDVIIGEGDAEADACRRPTSDQEGDRRARLGQSSRRRVACRRAQTVSMVGHPQPTNWQQSPARNRLPLSIRGRQQPAPIVKRRCNRSACGRRLAPSRRVSSVLRTRPTCWRRAR